MECVAINAPQVDTNDLCGEKVAIIGGGIVGLAHAWMAARRGCQVSIFERSLRAQGASIRNFGMVWPIGQPNGPAYRTALRSRAWWLELAGRSSIAVRKTGSLHLAYRDDELAVLKEFAEIADAVGYDCELRDAQGVIDISGAAYRDGLLAGLWSPHELNVDPREVIYKLPLWLESRYGVNLHYGVEANHVCHRQLASTDGQSRKFDRIVIASGSDFRMLFPDVFAHAGLRVCKLQMMRTAPQPSRWRMGPMIAGGLTLRHYESFAICGTLAALKMRVANETPELDEFKIHVMAAQNTLGEVVLGDSHEYGVEASPFDKSLIEELMLRELHKLIDIPNWTILERWHGVYPVLPGLLQYVAEPESNVNIAIATGGCGMTMSFGLAEQMWEQWYGTASTEDAEIIPVANKETQ